MNRRALLSSVATTGLLGVAGCQQFRAITGDDNTQRVVKLADQDSGPESHQVRITVDLLEQSVTDAHPARLEVSTTNEGPRRALSVGRELCSLFNRSDGGSDDPAGLWLYRPEDAQDLDREDDRWEPDRSRFSNRSYPAYGCGATRYDTGDSVSTEYEVWDDYSEGGYFEPDTYRWVQEIQLWDDPDAAGTESPTTTFTWEFSLTVERPDYTL